MRMRVRIPLRDQFINNAKMAQKLKGNINLQKLDDTAIVKFNDKVGLFIPLDANPCLFKGKKGVYLNLVIRELNNPNAYGSTHMITANVPDKEKRDFLGDALSSKQPILGNLEPFARQTGEEDVVGTVSAVSAADDDLPL